MSRSRRNVLSNTGAMPWLTRHPFRYSQAIVCKIPDSFKDHALRSNPDAVVDLEKVRKQHDNYIDSLRAVGVDILELHPNENYPDCPFVEDCAVVINETALICSPGAHTRVGEPSAIRNCLHQELGLTIVDIDSNKATLEGGDVLFTGKEIIVGISRRTNIHGAQYVAKTFPEYPTTIVKVPPPLLHLKSAVSVVHEDVLAVGESPEAQQISAEILCRASFGYGIVKVEENLAANVLFVNDTIIHQSKQVIPKGFRVLESKFDERLPLDFSEVSKVDGNLTSCAIFVMKVRHPKSFQTTLRRGQHELSN